MNLKQSYDEMIKAKSEADKVLQQFLIGRVQSGQIEPKDGKKLMQEWRELTNNIVKPFTQ